MKYRRFYFVFILILFCGESAYPQKIENYEVRTFESENSYRVHVYYTGKLESYLKSYLSFRDSLKVIGTKAEFSVLEKRRVNVLESALSGTMKIGLMHPTNEYSHAVIFKPTKGLDYFFLIDLDATPTSGCRADKEEEKNRMLAYYQKEIDKKRKYYAENKKAAKKVNPEQVIKDLENQREDRLALYESPREVGCARQVDQAIFENAIRSDFEEIRQIRLTPDGFSTEKALTKTDYLLKKINRRADVVEISSSDGATWYVLNSDETTKAIDAIASDGSRKVLNAIINDEGQLVSGQLIEFTQNLKSMGEFLNWKLEGQGIKEINGWIYAGKFSQGLLEGHGSLSAPDGMYYVGEFRQDKFEGEGKIDIGDGKWYEGGFRGGEFHGEGIYFDGNTTERVEYYEGERIDQAYQIRQERIKLAEQMQKEEELRRLQEEQVQSGGGSGLLQFVATVALTSFVADAVRGERLGTSLSDVADMLLEESVDPNSSTAEPTKEAVDRCSNAGVNYSNRVQGNPGCQPCAQCANLAMYLCAYDDALARKDQRAIPIWKNRARTLQSIILGYDNNECSELTNRPL